MRRTVRWAGERDEVRKTVTKEEVIFTTGMYGAVFFLLFAAGGLLWIGGRVTWAFIIWIIGNGLTAFFGTIAIGWDVLEYAFIQRKETQPAETTQGPQRELAPELGLPQDSKISLIITVVLFLLLGASTFVAKALL